MFCSHLGAASNCGTDKSPASAMCFVTPSATASTCETVEEAVWNGCFVAVSAAASTCRKACSCEIVRLLREQGGWWGGFVLGEP